MYTIDVVDVNSVVVGTADAVFDSHAFTVTIPLSILNDDGAMNVAAVMGNVTGDTDCVPDGGYLGIHQTHLPLVLRLATP